MDTKTQPEATGGERSGEHLPQPRSLSDFFEFAKKVAEDFMKTGGEVRPLAIGQDHHGRVIACTMELPRHGRDKDALVAGIRKLFEERNVVTAAFLSEGWSAEYDAAREDVPPSERPDRQEVVLVIAMDGTNRLSAQALIHRNPDKSFSHLAAWDGGPPGATADGRFFDLLPPRTVH